MATSFVHFRAADFTRAFPSALDPLPTFIDRRHFLDAWILNLCFLILLDIQTRLLSYTGA